ncbi:MAG: hypothetical protein RIB45_14090 [Marivibrio sp.]|uniref:hypothetical protein n=1 Tax=Marivibrio sp. TaxID=2039719 RepID=UPI0032EE2B5B
MSRRLSPFVALLSLAVAAPALAAPLEPVDRQLREAIDEGRLAETGLLARVHERCAGLKLNLLTMHQVTAKSKGEEPAPELMSLQPIMQAMVRRAIILRTAESEDPQGARTSVDEAVRRFAFYYGGEPIETADGEAALPEEPRALMQEDLNACLALHRRLSEAFTE